MKGLFGKIKMPQGIRAMMISVIVGVMIVVASAASFGFYEFIATKIIIPIEEERLSDDIEVVGVKISHFLEKESTILESLAREPEILTGDKAKIFPKLVKAQKDSKDMELILYADLQGNSINQTGATPSLAEREYFKEAIRTKARFVSDPLVSQTTKNNIVAISYPVIVNGEVKGIVAATINIKTIEKLVLDKKIGKTGYSYIFDSAGTVFAHPNQKLVTDKLNLLTNTQIDPNLKKTAQLAKEGKRGVMIYKFDGIEKFSSYAPVPGTKWGVSGTMPVEESKDNLKIVFWLVLGVFGSLTVIICVLLTFAIGRLVINPIQAIQRQAEEIAQGNFQDIQKIAARGELGKLANSFEMMAENTRTLIGHVQSTSEQIGASSEELNASAEQNALAAQEVAEKNTSSAEEAQKLSHIADQMNEKIQEMLALVKEAMTATNNTTLQVTKAFELTQSGQKRTQDVQECMNRVEKGANGMNRSVVELETSSKKITEIIGVISSIAGQTNLLALNAAIEAARAGDAGRGFAVVADEVRKLAEQTEGATKQIRGLIEDFSTNVGAIVGVNQENVTAAKQALDVILLMIAEFTQIMEAVKKAAGEAAVTQKSNEVVAKTSEELAQRVFAIKSASDVFAASSQTVAAVAQEQSASTEEISAASEALAQLGTDLTTAASKFKV